MQNNYDALKLENQLCFPLYACARETIKLYKPYLDQLDLTYTQYIAMMVLWEEEQINVKCLGERLFLDSGTLTPLLKKLEGKGYITRERSSEDERNLIITITQRGEELKDRAIDIPCEIAKYVNLEADEVKALYCTLYKMLRRKPMKDFTK